MEKTQHQLKNTKDCIASKLTGVIEVPGLEYLEYLEYSILNRVHY